ncbi:MAG: chemotaxis protein CheW [Gemmatimonadota bacterium]|nr:chemotaxis protein CheW [Gemmatimonadota bacterium]MDH4350610.1 chemotaxis protein CheW [Gemmatimonadota bacterium]MDH5197827.1 chemotaxis protein CheW [Gemmatimonadota bacterium]
MDNFSARLLVFRVADAMAAVEATTVREIISSQAATRIPGAPPAVQGLINVRGELVTLLRGHVLLGRSNAADGETVVLIRWGGASVAITVDEVVDLIPTSEVELTTRDDLPGIDPKLVRAVGLHAGRSFLVLDIDALLRPLLAA